MLLEAYLLTDASTAPLEVGAGWESGEEQLLEPKPAVSVEEHLEGYRWVIGMSYPLGSSREREPSMHLYEAPRSQCRYRSLPRTQLLHSRAPRQPGGV